MKKRAFITGINGQDGSYLSEFLLSKGYEIHGLIRRSSTAKTLSRLDPIKESIIFHYGDMTDMVSLYGCVAEILPDEIYNLAAQSQVGVSFVSPSYTENVNALGPLRLLEAIKLLKIDCKFYQASTSELYGNCIDSILDENSLFHPVSPYAIAKLNAYWYVRYFRDAYNVFAVNGILFNHESPRRGDDFVTKKIVKQACEIMRGERKAILLGNTSSRRDWGFAGDYVKAMWMMMQADNPDDYIIATGTSYSIEDFCNKTFSILGKEIEWRGEGANRVAYDTRSGGVVIEIDKKLYRPLDVKNLRGNYSKAERMLGWRPSFSLDDLIKEMVDHERRMYERDTI